MESNILRQHSLAFSPWPSNLKPHISDPNLWMLNTQDKEAIQRKKIKKKKKTSKTVKTTFHVVQKKMLTQKSTHGEVFNFPADLTPRRTQVAEHGNFLQTSYLVYQPPKITTTINMRLSLPH